MVTEMTLAEDLYKMWPPPLADEEQAVNALVHDLATCPLYDLPRLLTIRAKAMRLLAVTDHQPPVARLTQRESDALEALIRLSGRRKRQITTRPLQSNYGARKLGISPADPPAREGLCAA